MKLFSIASELHSEISVKSQNESFIKELISSYGENFEFSEDFGAFNSEDSLLYVRTGGTEGIFKSIFCRDGELSIPGKGPVRLLTSGRSNSLAASMEILSFLRRKGRDAEILHGSPESISKRLKSPVKTLQSSFIKAFNSKGALKGKRYGIIGRPSDWLISSDVNYAAAKEILGCELIDIEINELIALIRKGGYAVPEGIKLNGCAKFGKPISKESFSLALDVYGAIKEVILQKQLDGITLRCFDLLGSIGNTGCLALALLNAEGFIATCEGDIPTMLTMALGRGIYGMSGFQVNLSRVDADRLLFAHCTVPLDMVETFSYDTHFESGIGVAVHGEFKEGVPGMILKLGSDLKRIVEAEVTISRNQYEGSLCRTQVWVEAPGLSDYMLKEPLGNHHVIFLKSAP